MRAYDFDVLVIGRGPAGQKAAIQAAKLGRGSAIVERPGQRRRRLHQHRHDPVEDPARGRPVPDRHAQSGIYGDAYRVKDEHHDRGPLRAHAPRHRSRDRRHPRPAAAQPRELADGDRRFVDPHTLRVSARRRQRAQRDRASNVVIATGTTPHRPKDVDVRRAHGPRLRRHPAARAASRARWPWSAPA